TSDASIGGTATDSGGVGSLTASEQGLVLIGGFTQIWESGIIRADSSGVISGVDCGNLGSVSNENGSIGFSGTFINDTLAMVSGYGSFTAILGWTNDGTMQLFGGDSIINGDVSNTATGSMSFAADSIANFTNSVINAAGAATEFEFGGGNVGNYGQMIVDGDFSVDGDLSVSFVNGFELVYGQSFVIADIAGVRSGVFTGLDEGALVGKFNGVNLFITYAAGDGDDIALFTEPAPITPTLPMGRKFLDGFGVSGNLGSIHASNDQYWQIEPSPTTNPAKQKADLMLLGTSPTTSPTTFCFRLESRMTGGDPGPVIQQVYFITPSNNR
ncbi:MAG: hypothetical protein GY904_34060, partial [Planctomycetaceae bacterium]|nr:hypothetical protein [Planctomycetaceae bacterium]